MMKPRIVLIDIDSKWPNLALHKIAKYYRQRGHRVVWNPPDRKTGEMVFVSCLFTKNRTAAWSYDNFCRTVITGGTGLSLETQLAPEIERVKPRINLGFVTRGCPRNCPFCVVTQKEGAEVIPVADIYDIWDGSPGAIIRLMDGNILFCRETFFKICAQSRAAGVRLDFNQGLDIRLVDEDIAKELRGIRHVRQYRFAWDRMQEEDAVDRGLKILLRHIPRRRLMFYVLIGFDTTFDEDMYRVEKLRGFGADAFAMTYMPEQATRLTREFARWCNRFELKGMPFETFLNLRGYSFEDLLASEQRPPSPIAMTPESKLKTPEIAV